VEQFHANMVQHLAFPNLTNCRDSVGSGHILNIRLPFVMGKLGNDVTVLGTILSTRTVNRLELKPGIKTKPWNTSALQLVSTSDGCSHIIYKKFRFVSLRHSKVLCVEYIFRHFFQNITPRDPAPGGPLGSLRAEYGTHVSKSSVTCEPFLGDLSIKDLLPSPLSNIIIFQIFELLHPIFHVLEMNLDPRSKLETKIDLSLCRIYSYIDAVPSGTRKSCSHACALVALAWDMDIRCMVTRFIYSHRDVRLRVFHTPVGCSRFNENRLTFRLHGTLLDVLRDNNCSMFNVLVFLGGLGVAKSI
jgi:hypothetical protein